SEKVVHDLRTTTRRIEASLKLLPKDLRRSQAISRYLGHSKSLFKATSQIRDIDIIRVTLREFETIPEVSDLLKKNEEKRQHLLIACTRSARRFQNTKIPKIKTNMISESKLTKRKKKLVKRLVENLQVQSSVMLANPTLEELHEFRKNCKMLRYIVEIYLSKKEKRLLVTLKKLQTLLGSMMDAQATLQFLSQSSSEAIGPIREQVNSARSNIYGKFNSLIRSRFLSKAPNRSD
ncbi:MAG: CHAD domain-containing protein, partial [Nitrososphaerota archaeon]|nr:CHAD domain-containing protein [Nitrososphaerota archaeon]